MMHLNTLTGPDLYTGLDQWQFPSDGSDLRRGIQLKHIPRIFKLFLDKFLARHKFNQVFTGREFKLSLKAPTVIMNSCHEIKETDDPEVPVYLYRVSY